MKSAQDRLPVTELKPTVGTDCRFRRRNRIVDKASFGRVFKAAQRSRDKLFTVLYRTNSVNAPRLGLAIGKKNCRLATNRNRLKRIIRESFRRQYDSLPNIDIVVLNQPAAASAGNKALFASLEHHWQRCRAAVQERAGTD